MPIASYARTTKNWVTFLQAEKFLELHFYNAYLWILFGALDDDNLQRRKRIMSSFFQKRQSMWKPVKAGYLKRKRRFSRETGVTSGAFKSYWSSEAAEFWIRKYTKAGLMIETVAPVLSKMEINKRNRATGSKKSQYKQGDRPWKSYPQRPTKEMPHDYVTVRASHLYNLVDSGSFDDLLNSLPYTEKEINTILNKGGRKGFKIGVLKNSKFKPLSRYWRGQR